MAIRCKFPVISDLLWVWGKYYWLNQKELGTGKENARKTLHLPDNVLEKRVLREVFGNKIWFGGVVSLISLSSLFLMGLKQHEIALQQEDSQ